MELPLVHRLTQRFDHPRVADISGEVRRQILGSRLPNRLQPGHSVAIAVGSRGIANLAIMVQEVVATLKELHVRPFVVAAMGSHGGATAQGQRELLASYGITEETLGVPVRTDMDVVQIGTNSWNEPVYWDRNAFQADAVVTISRIKPHTDYHGRFESGIMKMLVIGLGKREGATTHHQYGVRGLRDMIPETAKVVLSKTPFALGLGVLENANEETARITAVEPDELFDVEPRLLEEARGLLARLPFDQLDLLVVGELGKNYSGTGMDVNVLGRQQIEGEVDTLKPSITRLCVLDVSAESHGNAVGLGLADLTTELLLEKMDAQITNLNYLTSCFLMRAKTPLAMPSDRACIEMGLKTCWQPNLKKVRAAFIPNTLELTEMWVTAPLTGEIGARAHLSIDLKGQPLPFDAHQNLQQEVLFPRSVRARRQLSEPRTQEAQRPE